jgi:phage terminase small subunit
MNESTEPEGSASKPLNDKQDRFCLEYLIDLNATAAAKRAGYSEDTAYSIGHELLKKPEIQDRIARLKAERSIRTQITADRVLEELAIVGFSNVQDYIVDDDGRIEVTRSAGEGSIRAVSSIRRKKKKYGHGENQSDEVEVELKLWPKVSALEKMGQHLGIFEKDNQQKQQPLSKITVEIIDGTEPKSE